MSWTEGSCCTTKSLCTVQRNCGNYGIVTYQVFMNEKYLHK